MVYFFTLLFFLISLSFSTVFERKLLAMFNFRFGPNKAFFMGIMIPFSDFLKLISKFYYYLFFVDFFYFIPFWGLFVFLLMLVYFPLMNSLSSFYYSVLYIFLFYSLLIYFFFFMGWSSKSGYCYISSFRILIQSISYEVGFVFCFLLLTFVWMCYDMFFYLGLNYSFIMSFVYIFFWFIFLISESGRSPFDFIEGESELVSGFNLEYFGGFFSLIFMVEYGLLILISMFYTHFLVNSLFFVLVFSVFCFIRCSFPRYRYDEMMNFFWKDLLILVFFFFFFFSFFF